MSDFDFFFSPRPAYPWSIYPLGLPALALVAALLILLTLWTYLGHPQTTRRRLVIILALRLAALVVALLTAVRPSVGVQETPNVPSVLLIGVDESGSMSVGDEVGSPARIDAVKRALERSKEALDALAEQNVEVVIYKFSTPDFNPDTAKFDPKDPADGNRSDYGTYLNKTYDRWQSEKYVRGHIVIGDGRDNGTEFSAVGEAGRWGRRGVPVTTVTVGSEHTRSDKKDIAVTALACVPASAPVKTDVEVVAEINAYNFPNQQVVVRVYFDDEPVLTTEATLTKERGNQLRLKVKAPDTPRDVKVRLEVGRWSPDEKSRIVKLEGELREENNSRQTRLRVTKEGVRLLVIDRLRWEETRLRDALRTEKRFDVVEVIRQPGVKLTRTEEEFLDPDAHAYDVVIIGNVPVSDLPPWFQQKVTERVEKGKMGLMFLGGEAAFAGIDPPPPGNPKTRPLVFADLVPVTVTPGDIVEARDKDGKPSPFPNFYQFVPTEKAFDDRVLRIAPTTAESKTLFNELNFFRNQSRITGYNKFTARPGAEVYAWASLNDVAVPAGTPRPQGADPLLVGLKTGVEDRGRVLAFAGYDCYLWERFGQPNTHEGTDVHTRFWRQVVLWLAHQEDEEGMVYARPEFPDLTIGGTQTVRVGLKGPDGGDDPDAVLTVKVLRGVARDPANPTVSRADPDKGEYDLADLKGRSIETAARDENSSVAKALARTNARTVERDQTGSKIVFKPPTPGEYLVVVSTPAYQMGPDGRPMLGPDGKPLRDPEKLYLGGGGFDVYPDESDEMLVLAADPEFMSKVAAASGGKAIRLDELPAYLRDLLKTHQLPNLRPRPKFVPDWRRNHSKGFLTFWLVVFTGLLGTEWGLRRLWGMV
jgi:hypothetical protein